MVDEKTSPSPEEGGFLNDLDHEIAELKKTQYLEQIMDKIQPGIPLKLSGEDPDSRAIAQRMERIAWEDEEARKLAYAFLHRQFLRQNVKNMADLRRVIEQVIR